MVYTYAMYSHSAVSLSPILDSYRLVLSFSKLSPTEELKCYKLRNDASAWSSKHVLYMSNHGGNQGTLTYSHHCTSGSL